MLGDAMGTSKKLGMLGGAQGGSGGAALPGQGVERGLCQRRAQPPTPPLLEPARTCSQADIKPAQTLHRLLLALFSVPHTQHQNSDNPPFPTLPR